MLPVALDLKKINMVLIGGGKQSLRRLRIIKDAGAENLRVFAEGYVEEIKQEADFFENRLPSDDDLAKAHIVLIADLEDALAFEIADRARDLGKLVNVEDRREYCDFFYSAIVRRGDLLIGVNTGGKSPALTVRIRKYLEELFPQIWQKRLDELAEIRQKMRQDGKSMAQILKKSNEYIDSKKWLDDINS